MPTFSEENLVMWRGYAHLVSLMDLLRLRTAGWVTEAQDRSDVHLGVLHATEEYATPEEAARFLDERAAEARRSREAQRARGRGDVWVHAEPSREDAGSGRVKTARARDAQLSRRRRRR